MLLQNQFNHLTFEWTDTNFSNAISLFHIQSLKQQPTLFFYHELTLIQKQNKLSHTLSDSEAANASTGPDSDIVFVRRDFTFSVPRPRPCLKRHPRLSHPRPAALAAAYRIMRRLRCLDCPPCNPLYPRYRKGVTPIIPGNGNDIWGLSGCPGRLSFYSFVMDGSWFARRP